MVNASAILGVSALLFIGLLIWSIMSAMYLFNPSKNPWRESPITIAPSSLVATASGVSLQPGVILQNGANAFVMQTDGNLAIYNQDTVKSVSKNQHFTSGTLKYDAPSKTCTMEFVGTPVAPGTTYSSVASDINYQGPCSLRLSDQGVVELVNDKSVVITTLDLNQLVGP
jgi:hypothetical protein